MAACREDRAHTHCLGFIFPTHTENMFKTLTLKNILISVDSCRTLFLLILQDDTISH